MTREVLTFYGETDGSSATGTFELDSDVLHSKVSYIRPDKGMECRIWARLLAGAACRVYVEQTEDVTESSPTWKKLGAVDLSSAGTLAIEDSNFITKLYSRDGKQAFRFTWEQSTPAKSFLEFRVEFVWGE